MIRYTIFNNRGEQVLQVDGEGIEIDRHDDYQMIRIYADEARGSVAARAHLKEYIIRFEVLDNGHEQRT